MIILENIKNQLSSTNEQIVSLRKSLGYDILLNKVSELQKMTEQDGFWNDISNSTKTLKELKNYENTIEKLDNISLRFTDISDLIDMANEEDDQDLAKEIVGDYKALTNEISTEKIKTLLDGEYDYCDAILTLHAGAGGTESQDWAEMLYRMYKRYAQRHNFTITVLDYLSGDEAGIKSVSFCIGGNNAYGFLKSENGVHRLVRISPFDSSGRRHTSFASLEVMPNIDDDVNIVISSDQLKIDTYRAGGAGGQHVNTTDSAVRITHIPSGVVVTCQNERSQHKNKDTAMKLLKSKLVKIKEQQNLDKVSDIKGVQKEIGWGSQIRSYVFMPYTLVKDHRTNFEKGNVSAVMDGDIGDFINEYLSQKSLGTLS